MWSTTNGNVTIQPVVVMDGLWQSSWTGSVSLILLLDFSYNNKKYFSWVRCLDYPRLSIHLNAAGRIRHAIGIASLTEKEVDFFIATGVSTSVRLSAVLSAFGTGRGDQVFSTPGWRISVSCLGMWVFLWATSKDGVFSGGTDRLGYLWTQRWWCLCHLWLPFW